jgi:hypothetical protein
MPAEARTPFKTGVTHGQVRVAVAMVDTPAEAKTGFKTDLA